VPCGAEDVRSVSRGVNRHAAGRPKSARLALSNRFVRYRGAGGGVTGGQGEAGGAAAGAEVMGSGVVACGCGFGFGLAAVFGFFFGGFAAAGGGFLTGAAITSSAKTGFGVMRAGGGVPVSESAPSLDCTVRTGMVCGVYPASVKVAVNSVAVTDSEHGVRQV